MTKIWVQRLSTCHSGQVGLFPYACQILEYAPVSFDLDGKSELHISTCPAGFPWTTSSIPVNGQDYAFQTRIQPMVREKTGSLWANESLR